MPSGTGWLRGAQATHGPPLPRTGCGRPQPSTACPQRDTVPIVTATILNPCGAISTSHLVTLSGGRIYLPLVQKYWPPVPTLDPVDQNDGLGSAEPDGNYTVRWSIIPQATSYKLEEAESANFDNPQVVYQGPTASYIFRDRDKPPAGSAYDYHLSTYYYHVQACDGWGCGPWSNTNSATVSCIGSGQGQKETISMLPTLAAGIRISMTAKALPQYGYSLWEAEIYGPATGGSNLASGGEACASSVEDLVYHPPEKAIDGDKMTRWASVWWSDTEWLEIRFPAPEIVDEIVLYWELAYATEYCVTVIPPGSSGLCE